MTIKGAHIISRLAIFFAVVFTLIACGGGGGGGSFYDPDSDGEISIAPGTLAEATAGVEYFQILEATGGDEPYSWAILDDSGTGLTINNSGILNGTVLESGDFSLTIRVEDSVGRRAVASYVLAVTDSGLTITNTALDQAIKGIEYFQILEATGGDEPYSWVILDDGGTGLTINDGGILNGIVLESGDFGLTIQVEDSVGSNAVESYVLRVAGGSDPGPLTIATNSLPDGTPGADYNALLVATGGQSDDYEWTLENDGDSGLKLSKDGLLNGTAPDAGQYILTVSVQDGVVTSTKKLQLGVNPSSLEITTSSLTNATVGVKYVFVLEASGGIAANYKWDLVDADGTGLALNQYGVLSGTVAVANNYALIVQVFDGITDVRKALSLIVTTSSD